MKTTTPKQEMFTHLSEGHGFKGSYHALTYVTLRRIHLQMHRGQYQGHVANHYHVARGVDPAERPEGWNDSGNSTVVLLPSPEWKPAMDGDEQYGWRLDLPGNRSAFVAPVVDGMTLLAGPAPVGSFEWSVGGVTNAYVDAEGVKATLWAAQRAAEVAAR